MLLDILFILIILTITIAGYRKGIIMSLVTLLILMLSCVGAFMAQQAFAAKASAWLQPRLENVIEEKLDAAFSESVSEDINSAENIGITIGGTEVSVQDLVELLSKFGVDVEATAQNAAEQAAEPQIAQYSDRIAQVLCDWIAGLLVFLVAFLACYLVLHSVELVAALADRVPEIRILNHLGGGIIGFVSAVFILTILVSAFLRAGVIHADQAAKPVFSGIRDLAEMIS